VLQKRLPVIENLNNLPGKLVAVATGAPGHQVAIDHYILIRVDRAHVDRIAIQVVALSCGCDAVFDKTWPVKVRQAIHCWLARQAGDYPKGEPSIAQRQPFYLDILYFVLREAGDPDFAVCKDFSGGVNLGVTEPLPHTPAVFELQTSWRLEENPLEVPELYSKNYASTAAFVSELTEQFLEEEREGMFVQMPYSEFKLKYHDGHAISSLAVLQEKTKLRSLYDGTHHTKVNHRIKTRDKIRMPTPREKAFLLNNYKSQGRIGIRLLCDFAKAHRLTKVREEDWKWQACILDRTDNCLSKADATDN
jgi:hypothetical protein